MLRFAHPTDSLPDYADRLVTRVVHETGFPVVLHAREGIGYDFWLRTASDAHPWHDLAVTPEYQEYWLHFLVSASVKILRFWDAPPDDRLVPVTAAGRSLPGEEHVVLAARFPQAPAEVVQRLSAYLYEGLVRQVTSMPLDLRVERHLAASLPEHYGEQSRYLRRQVADIVPHFDPAIAAATPPLVYAASTAMNVALALESADLTQSELPGTVRGSPHYEAGLHLDALLRAASPDDHVGDRVLTDAWASALGVRDWYTWASGA